MKGKVNDQGTLFAQIRPIEIARELKSSYNVDVEESWIKLMQPVKKIGEYKVELNLPNSGKIVIKLNIVASN